MKAGYETEAAESYGEAYVSGPITSTFGVRLAVRASRMDGPFDNVAEPAVDSFGNPRGPQSPRRGANRSISGRLTLKWSPSATTDWTFKLGGTSYRDNGGSEMYERKCGGGRTTPLPTFGLADRAADCVIDGRSDHASIALPIALATPYLRPDPFTLSKSYYGSLTGNYHLGDFTLSSITGYYGYLQKQADELNGSTAGVYFGQYSKFRQFSEEARLSSDFDGLLNGVIGAFYSSSNSIYDSTAVSAALPADANGRYEIFQRVSGIDAKTISAFAELRYKFLTNLELAAGARWTRDQKDSNVANVYSSLAVRGTFPLRGFVDRFHDNNISPQATLTWKPSSDLTIYGAYKEGYKAGGFNTSMTVTAGSRIGDGQFGSEYVKGGEAGLRTKTLSNHLSVNLTGYYYRYSQLQVQTFNAATLATIVENAGKLSVRGIEGEFIWDVPSTGGLQFSGSAAFNRATYSDFIGGCWSGQTVALGCNLNPTAAGVFTAQNYQGRTAAKAPEFAGRIGATYAVPLSDRWTAVLSTDVNYSGRYNFSDNLRPDTVQAAFARWNAGVRFTDDRDKLEFAIFAKNLTNKYIVTSSAEMAGQPAPGTGTGTGLPPDLNVVVERPREIYFQVTKRF
jgi:outer membrane receptor protein involved in Fe transport